jgi:hypothetical protein
MRNGFEYEVVESCLNSGRDFLSPIAWHGKNRIPGKQGGGGPEFERKDRPIYTTCACCPEQVSNEWIEERNKKNRKRGR